MISFRKSTVSIFRQKISFTLIATLSFALGNNVNGKSLPNSHKPATEVENSSDWTIMIYMQARSNLASFASQNMQEIASVGVNKKNNIVIQWEQPDQPGISRYQLKGNKIFEAFSDPQATNNFSPGDRLCDFVKWSTKNYRSKHYALILWNHGLGALDPVWGRSDFARMISYHTNEGEETRININGAVHSSTLPLAPSYDELITSTFTRPEAEQAHRGILFDFQNRVYMTHSELANALEKISPYLPNHKLDILGFDACYMAMTEVAYLVKDYARIMVGSQEVELARGWYYKNFLTQLKNKSLSPEELARAIVDAHGRLYQGKTHLYSLSALHLEHASDLKENLDTLVESLEKGISSHGNKLKKVISKARKHSLEFSMPTFIDLHSFYSELLGGLNTSNFSKNAAQKSTVRRKQIPAHLQKRPQPNTSEQDHHIAHIKELLAEGISLLERAILHKTASTHLKRSHGLSIYFPSWNFEQSYLTNSFSQQSRWPTFLKTMVKTP